MNIPLFIVEKLIFFESHKIRRFTQDSPVFPDVWLRFFQSEKDDRLDLLLIPHRSYSASKLIECVRKNLKDFYKSEPDVEATFPWELATSSESVVGKLNFYELIFSTLTLTNWWNHYLWKENHDAVIYQLWFKSVAGGILWSYENLYQEQDFFKDIEETRQVFVKKFDEEVKARGIDLFSCPQVTCLWSININRPVYLSLYKSVSTTKADATRRVFDVDGSGIRWAIIDSGIDARHKAFRKVNQEEELPFDTYMLRRSNRNPASLNQTRIVATYDFTKLRYLMSKLEHHVMSNAKMKDLTSIFPNWLTCNQTNQPLNQKEIEESLIDLRRALKNGRMVDWSIIAPLIRVPHNSDDYIPPMNPHGTHVAGILGANMEIWDQQPKDRKIVGMCPGIEIYDLRVINEQGQGDEFSVLGAVQFVKWLNKQKDQPIIHGVNISLSLNHAVRSYACGRTPICEACEALVSSGSVVVVAAGNEGRAIFEDGEGAGEQGFRTVSITDPGNAEAVITVGATHRNKPQTYGVSYFSSRGPTGDGRRKPDLVAPGEKIHSTIPGDSEDLIDRMDGTSMSAPFVSGAAALILAKNRELIGQPEFIKKVICETATDLNREHYFQGFGLLDTLRAMQRI